MPEKFVIKGGALGSEGTFGIKGILADDCIWIKIDLGYLFQF